MLDSQNGGRSQGLGSGYSDYAKDCGYQLDTQGHGFQLMSSGSFPAYGGDVRSRLISNALLFAAQCWGHLAIGHTPAIEICHRNYTYMESEFSSLERVRRPRAYGESIRWRSRHLAIEPEFPRGRRGELKREGGHRPCLPACPALQPTSAPRRSTRAWRSRALSRRRASSRCCSGRCPWSAC